jgi:hypothetical protein
MTYRTRITTFCLAIFFSLSFTASAGEVPDLIQFTDGQKAKAKEVNGNFNAVKTAVDDNHQKIQSILRNQSVTYSAMGFTPDKSEADSFDHATEFEKKAGSGSLNCLEQDGCSFYHSVNLRTGVTITQIRAHVFDSDDTANNASIELKLQKKMIGENMVTNLASETSDNSGDQVFGTELDEFIEWSSTEYPPSYFIEVVFGNSSKNVLLFSVTIDFTYTAP